MKYQRPYSRNVMEINNDKVELAKFCITCISLLYLQFISQRSLPHSLNVHVFLLIRVSRMEILQYTVEFVVLYSK